MAGQAGDELRLLALQFCAHDTNAMRMSACGTKRACCSRRVMSVIGG